MSPLNSDTVIRFATCVVALSTIYLFHLVGYDLHRAPAYLRANGRWIGLSAAMVIAAGFALLLSPAPPAGSDCVYTDRWSSAMQFVTSCDSDEFLVVAQHPGRLVEANSYRQSRPLVVMAAGVLTAREPRILTPMSEDSPVGQPGWLSYIAINTVLLVCALMLFRRLSAPISSVAVLAVGILSIYLVFNDVVKGFFWSAHTQMWNVLMPLIAVAVSQAFLERPQRSAQFMLATGLLLGLGFLAYASFLVCLAAAVISIGARRHVGILLAAFAAPTLIWIGIIKITAGGFFVSEASEFREFIWILDALREGGMPALVAKSWVFLTDFAARLWEGLWPVLVVLGIVLAVGLASPAQLRDVMRARRRVLIACLLTSMLCLVFFAALGFYRNRLAFNVVIPILVGASAITTGLLERQPRRLAITTLLLCSVAATGYIVSALSRVTWPY